jgi:ABC-type Mn2+/Zn2+ transport system permease subunit
MCSTPPSDLQDIVHWLTDPFQAEFMQRAFLAAIIIGIVAPVVGTWVVLRRMANLGDAMSHGTLAGVGIAYALGVNVLFGAMGAGLILAVLLLTFSSNRRLGQETVIAVLGTAFFALGVVVISRLDTGVELTHFLFGRVLTVQWSDIALNLVLGGIAVAVVLAMFGELRLATFDHVQAEQVGVRVELVQTVLVLLLAVVVVISLRAVGTVMAVTMLVTPAATARLFTRTLQQMTLWGVAFGVSEGVVGLMVSYHLSSAPGATIGLVAATVFAAVFAITLPRRMPHHHRPLD